MPDTIILDSDADLKIGFPPPMLGPEPVRLPAAQVGEGLLALALPGGVVSDAHPFYRDAPCVIASLQAQLREEKPELQRLGMDVALAVNCVEPEISGLLLVAMNRAGVERWRNAYGSGQLQFTFEFVAAANASVANEVVCDLPVARHKARHKSEPRMLVSHKTGKKSRTEFRRKARKDDFEIWTATTTLPRLHQIRLHAMEIGLKLPGDALYEGLPMLTWGALKGKKGPGGECPILERPLIHLKRIEAIDGLEGFMAVESRPEGRLAQIWAEFQ